MARTATPLVTTPLGSLTQPGARSGARLRGLRQRAGDPPGDDPHRRHHRSSSSPATGASTAPGSSDGSGELPVDTVLDKTRKDRLTRTLGRLTGSGRPTRRLRR